MAKTLDQIEQELKAPFKPDEIEWRVGSTNSEKTKGLALAYVTNRAIQNRLDQVFGIAGWRNEFTDWKGKGVLCGISCKVEGEWLTKWDGAEETNMEATKGGLSDAMKRAGYQWGIGRYLYELDSQWVEVEKRGNSCFIKKGKEPKLPAWALPKGVTQPTTTTQQDEMKGFPSTLDGVPEIPPEPGQRTKFLSTANVKRLQEQRAKLGTSETEFKTGLGKMVGFPVNDLHDLAQLEPAKLKELIAALDKVIAKKQVAPAAEGGNNAQ